MARGNASEVAGDEDRCVRDEDVEAAPLLDHALDAGLDALGVAEVEDDREGGAALGSDLGSDGVDRAGEPRVDLDLGAGGDGDLCTGAGEVPGDVGANPAAGSGDERNATFERHGGLPSRTGLRRSIRRAGRTTNVMHTGWRTAV